MNSVELYTLNKSQASANIGDYIELVRQPSRYNTSIVPISGIGPTTDIRLLEIPSEHVACKVYRLCEPGKPERLVAIEPDLVDTIQFVALEKVREQLEDENFRVENLIQKLAVAEHALNRERQKLEDLVAEYRKLEYEAPIWKIIYNRFLNWYTN